ncbi:MAG: DUF4190 domain-containing protein [Verrucomicrobiales bacterium]|nr:DUF4190 domain-containing protein [Verrucomicrobiales bacterium]
MSIETICEGCKKRLRVADEHAGRLAKCPHCQLTYTVPQSLVAASWGAGNATNSDLPPSDRWHLKTPDGLSFGPVARAELDRWLAEGRVTSASQILHEGDGQWVWAAQAYPHLGNSTSRPGASQSPFAPGTLAKPIDLPLSSHGGNVNPYASPAAAGYAPPIPQRYREPARGGTILTMSIVGMFVCFFLSIAAVAMGFTDLSEMKRGIRDPSGRGLTIAGVVIGCISIGLVVLQLGIVAVAMVLDS